MQMDTIQKTARDFWLSGINFENDFKPNSDLKTSEYMKSIGHVVSKSGIFKWRKRYDWNKDLEFRIKQLTSEDKKVKASLGAVIKDEAVQKTIVDLERNKCLLGQGYEILEIKCKLIMETYRLTGKISEKDTQLALQITKLSADREDRMMDRKVVSDALGKDEALKAIAKVAGEIEFEGEFEDAAFEMGEMIEAQIEEDDDE